MSSIIMQQFTITILRGIPGKKITVYIGISWNVKGLDRTHTLPQTADMFKHGCRTIHSLAANYTLLSSTSAPRTAEGLWDADYRRNKSEAHKLAHFCKLNSEQVVLPGPGASERCLHCAVSNNRVVGTVSNTARRKDNFHLQALNTCLPEAIRRFVI